MNRYFVSRFKRWIYGPQEAARHLKQRLSGELAQMRVEYADCRTIQEHWEFAMRHFAPCQKPVEILDFLKWIKVEQPKIIVEIGVARGGTNYLLRNCVPSVQKVIGVDFFARNARLHRTLYPDTVRLDFVSGASAHPSTVAKVKRLLENRAIDLLFIDGDHSYVGAMADYHAYAPLVAPGGWIAFHDIVPQARNFDGSSVNGFEVAVDRVWKELSRSRETVEFIAGDDRTSYGIGCLRKDDGEIIADL